MTRAAFSPPPPSPPFSVVFIPFRPHLLFPLFVDDDETDRFIGRAAPLRRTTVDLVP